MTTPTAQAQVFRLPDLGEGLAEAEILHWKVTIGDAVEVDQVVVEVETAKAAVEVPVPYAGTVLAVHGEPGSVISVGTPLISIGPANATAADPGRHAQRDERAAERYREEELAGGSGKVLIGYGTGNMPAGRRRARVKAPRPAVNAVPIPVVPSGGSEPPGPRVISPLVRKLARQNGVGLRGVIPTGAGGVIRFADVTAAIEQRRHSTAATHVAAPHETGEIERIPLRGMRRVVADKLTRSRTEIPDATTWVDADATELVRLKDALRAALPDQRIGLLALLARICVAALRRYPDLNASVDTEHGEILRYPHINLGYAAQTDRGLVVPVIRGAHRLSLAQLQAESGRLTALARRGKMPQADLTGGTFTLNNYGVFGVDGSTPIINHPEAAILGVGRITDKPWVVDGQLAVRKVTQLSLTFDHRVCDGGVAGGFLRYVADCVEQPAVLVADL